MITTRRTLMFAVVATSAAGCSLLKAPDPVRLFRFGQSAGEGGGATPTANATVLYTGTSFPRAAAGDRILTADGVQVSYVGGSRWATPALNQFDEAVARAFQVSPVRLIRRGGGSRADAVLRIEVRTFEVRYATPGAPVVVVAGRAILTSTAGETATVDRLFSVEQPATEDRVSAIAEAFDSAVSQVLTETVTWTQGAVRAAPAA